MYQWNDAYRVGRIAKELLHSAAKACPTIAAKGTQFRGLMLKWLWGMIVKWLWGMAGWDPGRWDARSDEGAAQQSLRQEFRWQALAPLCSRCGILPGKQPRSPNAAKHRPMADGLLLVEFTEITEFAPQTICQEWGLEDGGGCIEWRHRHRAHLCSSCCVEQATHMLCPCACLQTGMLELLHRAGCVLSRIVGRSSQCRLRAAPQMSRQRRRWDGAADHPSMAAGTEPCIPRVTDTAKTNMLP